MDVNSLAHTKWNCKYHIVFAPKYRRKVAYGQLKRDIANILSTLCKRKGVKIVEAEICPDHVHMLIELKFLAESSLAQGEGMILLVGMVVAFVVSLFVIKFLMGYIKKLDFKVFGWYRIVLGSIVLIYGILGII